MPIHMCISYSWEAHALLRTFTSDHAQNNIIDGHESDILFQNNM
jgi:hypothetical protein